VVDDQFLRYKYLNNFDSAMNHVAGKYGWLEAPQAFVSLKHESDKMIVFERAGLLFVFNFHPMNSYADYRVGVDVEGEYGVVLNSDEKERFGGFDNVESESLYFTTPGFGMGGRIGCRYVVSWLFLGVGCSWFFSFFVFVGLYSF